MLEEKVLNAYMANKTMALADHIRKGILLGGINWTTPDMSTDINEHVLQILLCMVSIHEEIINTIETKIAYSIIETLTGNMYQIYLDYVKYITFSDNGAKKIQLEIQFIETVMKNYLSPIAKSILKSLYAAIHVEVFNKKKTKAKVTDEEIVNSALNRSKILFECFV